MQSCGSGVTTSQNKGQYFNAQGEVVDNIADASKLVISKYTKTETVSINELSMSNEITVNEIISESTFDVVDGEQLSFVDGHTDSVTKTKDISMASESLIETAEKIVSDNKATYNTEKRAMEAESLSSQAQREYDQMIIEMNQKID